MKLKQEEIERIVSNVLTKLKAKNLITFKVQEDAVKTKMIDTFVKNLEEEDRLDEEVEEILKKFQNEIDSGEVDYRKMFMKIKSQLAKDKKIII